ncbi:DUF5047 domain-containing protein [Streptomyces sp. NPDC006638]|uniref:DUF5047 domain-containing protein n=1 Tax=Streptomyces sp. NPDC006638 TaxID=3157183 RepID=UPI0033AE4A27
MDAYYSGLLTLSDIPISGGTVTVDRGSKTRRSLSVTVSDPRQLPWDAADPLAVYGQTLVASRGIRFPSGAEEMVPLGTFRINDVVGDVLLGPVTVSGTSMECAIIDDKLQAPTTTRAMGNCFTVIQTLIQQTLPTASVVNLTTGARNPACAIVVWDAGADRWDAVVQVATAMQAEVFVDATNRFVVVDSPNILVDPVAWDVAEGEGGTLISSARQMSRTSVYTAVVASGENTASGTAPVSATARDTDALSPTRWGGPFGKITKNISSALWTSVGLCQSAADNALFDATAANIQTTVDSLPNEALEGGDVLRVAHAGRRELYLAQSIVIPLTADGDFSLTLRGGKEDPT